MAGNLGDIYINGATDNTEIGNISDSLKVSSSLVGSGGSPQDFLFDSFHRMKVSNPRTLFQSTFRYSDRSESWDQDITGSATIAHNANEVSIDLDVTTGGTDKAILQSTFYAPYFPGKGQGIFMTGSFIEAEAGVRKRIGYFDDENGAFFELDGSDLYVVLRSKVSGSVVDTRVIQSAWNIDKLDGTGSSGETLDVTKQQIFVVDFQWLGSGQVRFGFDIGGTAALVHNFVNANILSVPYSQSGQLPARYEIEVTGSPASATSIRATCVNILSDGGAPAKAPTWAYSPETEITINSTFSPLFSVRMHPSKNRSVIIPQSLRMVATSGTKAILMRLVKNPVLTGESWVDVGEISQYDTSATSSTGGSVLQYLPVDVSGSTVANESALLSSEFFAGREIDGTSEILMLEAATLTGTGSVIWSTFFQELI